MHRVGYLTFYQNLKPPFSPYERGIRRDFLNMKLFTDIKFSPDSLPCLSRTEGRGNRGEYKLERSGNPELVSGRGYKNR
jgi:hypothetical protein